MIEMIECLTHLTKHADAFGPVLAKLSQPVMPAPGESVHLRSKRIRPGKSTITIADVRARGRQPVAEPGESRDQVIEHVAGQVKISSHIGPLLAISPPSHHAG